jgi:hypothetical protein
MNDLDLEKTRPRPAKIQVQNLVRILEKRS